LLIYCLQAGTKRFRDLRRDNPAISHKMLTQELRKLESAGIVLRAKFDGYPLCVEYGLTPAGKRLLPLIDALGDWWQETSARAPEAARKAIRISGENMILSSRICRSRD
jgi:DNA-binding HxlR family transcriptional regulator